MTFDSVRSALLILCFWFGALNHAALGLTKVEGKGNFKESVKECARNSEDLVYLDDWNAGRDHLEEFEYLAQEAILAGCNEDFLIGLNRLTCKDEYWWEGGISTSSGAPSFQNVRARSTESVLNLTGSASLGRKQKCVAFSPSSRRFYNTDCDEKFSICCGDSQSTVPETDDRGGIETIESIFHDESEGLVDIWVTYLFPSTIRTQYVLLTQCMSRERAAQTCRSINAQPARIRTAAEKTVVDRLTQFAQGLDSPFSPNNFEVVPTKGAWVGAAQSGRTFYYTDNLVPENIIAFKRRKPSRNKYCVYYRYQCNDYGYLDSMKCNKCLQVLCECNPGGCDLQI